MFSKTVTVESVTFELKKNPRKASIVAGQYAEKLFGAYGGRREALNELAALTKSGLGGVDSDFAAGAAIFASPKYQSALAWKTQVEDFSRVAGYINSAIVGFIWPNAEASVEDIKQAFEWLLDNPDVWDALEKGIEDLELPNGLVGAPVEIVGTVASDSPLASSGLNGNTITGNG